MHISTKMPATIPRIRRSICALCDDKCADYIAGQIDHNNPRAQCGRAWPSRWGCYGKCNDPTMQPAPPRGLGDLVAAVAQPIARAIDALAGTKIQGCGGCAARREALNRAVPDISNPLRH